MVVYIVTDNNYFFIGLQAALEKEHYTVKRIAHRNAATIDSNMTSEVSAFIFHVSQYDYLPYSLFLFMNHSGRAIIVSPGHLIKFYSSFNLGHVINEKSEIQHVSHLVSRTSLGEKTPPCYRIRLTHSERNILLHMMSGHSATFISHSLAISRKTVYTHKRNALHKLGARKVTDIIRTRKSINPSLSTEDISIFLMASSLG